MNVVVRFLDFVRRRLRSFTQPVLTPDEQRRRNAERSSDGTGHGGMGPG